MSPKSATKYNLLYRGINFLATLQLVCPTKENFPWLIRDRPLKDEHTKRKTLSIQSWHSCPLQEPQPNGEQKTPWLDVRGQTPHLLSWEVTPLFLKPKVETLAVKMRTSMTLSLNPTFLNCKDTTFSGIPTHWSVNLLLILVFSFVVSCFWCIFAAFKIKSKDKIQIDIIAYTCSRSTAFVGIT